MKHPQTGKALIPARTLIDSKIVELLEQEKVSEVVINSVREVKEQKIFLGEMPVMSPTGTFMINGVERVIVSQMHRSPGAFFSHDKGKSHVSGKILHSARVIPDRGSWLDFEFDIKDILHVKIDRRRKMPATILLNAFGMNQEEILSTFYPVEKISCTRDGKYSMGGKGLMVGIKVLEDVADPKTNEVIVKSGKKVGAPNIKKLSRMARSPKVEIDPETLLGTILANDLIDKETGEVMVESNTEITRRASRKNRRTQNIRVRDSAYRRRKPGHDDSRHADSG